MGLRRRMTSWEEDASRRTKRSLEFGRLPGSTYWAVGLAYIGAYVALERATFAYQLDGLGITLWSPSAGLSLLLLMAWGSIFAPFLFAASLITDFAVYSGPRGWFAPIATSFVLMVGLSLLAQVLKRGLHSGQPRLAQVGTLLAVVPSGTLIVAVTYCMVLYATNQLSSWSFLLAVRNFWIGDTLGIITLVPAAPAALSLLASWRRPIPRRQIVDAVAFVTAGTAALWIIFGVRMADEYQFFYLLFLPIIWIAVRQGYAGVATALLLTHVALVSTATVLGYAAYDFIAFQMLMLVLSATGLLLGAAVTEGRRSEERFRTQQADLARAARQALVGATGTALAHEISQPLSSATNYLHAASRMLRTRKDADHAAIEALGRAQMEAQRARETLERVRDYVSSGRLETTSVDLEVLMTNLVTLTSSDGSSRDVDVRISSTRHLPTIRGDIIQLEQLFLNLISNAIDAACQTEEPRGCVSVHIAQHHDRIAISVEDNGPGIAPEIADRLFEPFETTKPQGMGLGLTLVRQIVEAHGGELRCENRLPSGARFTVELAIDGPGQPQA